jgi:RNA polymerase sigma-70 factor, ECF subfamily
MQSMSHSQEPDRFRNVQGSTHEPPKTRAELEKLSDEELMLRFQRDDMVAYDILVARYKDPLMNFIFRFVGDRDDAADLLQETFLRVYRKRHLYETIAKFSTWAYTIAGNLAKSELRKPYRRLGVSITRKDSDDEEHELQLTDRNPTPDRMADSALKAEFIQRALGQLNADFREAVILRDIQDLEYDEIAAILGLPLGTVKSRINRGRGRLQELLKELYD